MACRAPTDAPGQLCGACWSEVDFLTAPFCARCGLPFDYDLGADVLCAGCLAAPPAFDQARAAMRYGPVARRLVVGLKHADRTHLAPPLAAWMGRAGEALLRDADLLIPVPLHRRRLLSRRFNQSLLLARSLGKESGLPVVADAMLRRRATPPQAGLSRNQRRRNVAAAFAVRPARKALIEGRRVLLIDDVLTTGATATACARTLKRAGAGHVAVLTLARVVLED
jgi:ComF family protein